MQQADTFHLDSNINYQEIQGKELFFERYQADVFNTIAARPLLFDGVLNA